MAVSELEFIEQSELKWTVPARNGSWIGQITCWIRHKDGLLYQAEYLELHYEWNPWTLPLLDGELLCYINPHKKLYLKYTSHAYQGVVGSLHCPDEKVHELKGLNADDEMQKGQKRKYYPNSAKILSNPEIFNEPDSLVNTLHLCGWKKCIWLSHYIQNGKHLFIFFFSFLFFFFLTWS